MLKTIPQTKNFDLTHTDAHTKTRAGILPTAHGPIETPFFMPVGTHATVKTLSSEDLLECGAQIVLSNTYHLFVRPGMEVIKAAGGLHKFMNWQKPVLTDSGGYQIFSLTKFRKITDDGVKFRSHFDGAEHFFTPEDVVSIQKTLGSDIIMPLDECVGYPSDREVTERALKRTTLWAGRSKDFFVTQNTVAAHGRASLLFGIVQGGMYPDLRKRSLEEISEIGFDGVAIGGLSVGEPDEEMFEILEKLMPFMPTDKPRYLMGLGTPDQIVKAVALGVDMFDTCVPTRYGRHGSTFTGKGKVTV